MTQQIVERWAEMNNIPFLDAAREIKYLMDLGTIEKSPAPAELEVKQPTDIIHEIG